MIQVKFVKKKRRRYFLKLSIVNSVVCVDATNIDLLALCVSVLWLNIFWHTDRLNFSVDSNGVIKAMFPSKQGYTGPYNTRDMST
jgi:hypothetical protein